MSILVPVKKVIDPYVKIRVNQDGSGVETHQVKMVMNPFDEIALEQAIRLKEKGLVREVVCASIGDSSCQEILRHGLALGADRAILVETKDTFHSLQIAKILKKIIEIESFKLILMGKQAIDTDANQTPQMLAGLLDWPQAMFISQIEISESTIQVIRETDIGLEHLEVSLPAVVSVDLRLNVPRYATLPNIMKAKSKPLSVMALKDLNIDIPESSVQCDKVLKPQSRARGEILENVQALIEKVKPLIQA